MYRRRNGDRKEEGHGTKPSVAEPGLIEVDVDAEMQMLRGSTPNGPNAITNMR